MTGSWGGAAKRQQEHQKKHSMFLRLARGEQATIIFVGQPIERETVYIDGKITDYNPDDPAHRSKGPSLRFKTNAFVVETRRGDQPPEPIDAMRIAEVPGTVAAELGNLEGRFPMDQWSFVLDHKSDNSYSIQPGAQITAEQVNAISDCELYDLDRRASDTSEGGDRPI